MEYLTDEDFKYAKERGISYKVCYDRFYVYGWTKERTINEPVKQRGKRINYPKEWIKKAAENGINDNLFRYRVSKGLTPEQAATLPKIKNKKKTYKVAMEEFYHDQNRNINL